MKMIIMIQLTSQTRSKLMSVWLKLITISSSATSHSVQDKSNYITVVPIDKVRNLIRNPIYSMVLGPTTLVLVRHSCRPNPNNYKMKVSPPVIPINSAIIRTHSNLPHLKLISLQNSTPNQTLSHPHPKESGSNKILKIKMVRS